MDHVNRLQHGVKSTRVPRFKPAKVPRDDDEEEDEDVEVEVPPRRESDREHR